MKEKTFTIFNSWDRYEDEVMDDIRASLAECNEMELSEVSDEWVNDSFWNWLEDERMNLNEEVDGVIIAMANVGTWRGLFPGYKIFDGNIASILHSYEDDVHWYADKYNVRMNSANHDASSSAVYRVAKSYEDAERIAEKIYNGEMDEQTFFRQTKSLRPYIAKIYGWKNYGRQSA